MDHHDLTGYYTYRSFLNRQDPADDFNTIRFGEGELFLWVAPDGSVQGTLAFPAAPVATEKDFMDVTGRVTSWSPPTVEFEGVGRPETGTADFDYRYQANLAPTFTGAINQRLALVGTVLRAKPHGSAPAGFSASFVAVKRDFLRPKDIPGVALIPDAVTMLASRRHRLQHAVWHTVRTQWHGLSGDVGAVEKIKDHGWWPERPPFQQNRALDLENGAGEDFLFMHRKMILMLKDAYGNAGQSPPAGWTALPAAGVPQTVYNEANVSGSKTFLFAPDVSGFMVPPPAREDDGDRMLKSPSFLSGVMRPLSSLFRSPRLLQTLTLGALGNLLEFTIHGWMHVRWTHTLHDPDTGAPIGRESLFDIDPKWDDPANDDLGDFYSSHVHPTFWRLHGWIDDRINDWARVNADRITTTTVDDVPWFVPDGTLVQVEHPFYWPRGQHGSHAHHGDHGDVHVMEEVMGIMRDVLVPPPGAAPSDAGRAAVVPARVAFREALLGVTLSAITESEV
jgi:hypothetical protein